MLPLYAPAAPPYDQSYEQDLQLALRDMRIPTDQFAGDLEIRPALVSDADQLFPLVQQFATSYRPDRAAFDRHLPLLVAAHHAVVLVAERNGQLLGYAAAFRLPTLLANGVVAELQELMVAPEQRGNGIGQRLVADVCARARAAGAVEVTVPTRRAGGFYRRLGFEETAAYFKRKLPR